MTGGVATPRHAHPCLRCAFPVNCFIAHEETRPSQDIEAPAPTARWLAAHPAEPARQTGRGVVCKTCRATGSAACAERVPLPPHANARIAAQVPDRRNVRSSGRDGIG